MRYLWSSCCIAAKFDGLWCLISAKSRSYCRQSAARYEANVCMLQFAKLTNTVGSRQSGIVWLFCSSYFTNSAFLPILTSCLLLRPLLGVEVLRWPCLSVCLSVFVRKHISGIERPIFTKFLCMLPMADGSVVLWRRCDTLCASGFVDGVMFVYNASRPRNSDWIRSSMDLSPWHIIQTDPPAGSTDRGGVWNLRLPCLYTLASLIDLLSI